MRVQDRVISREDETFFTFEGTVPAEPVSRKELWKEVFATRLNIIVLGVALAYTFDILNWSDTLGLFGKLPSLVMIFGLVGAGRDYQELSTAAHSRRDDRMVEFFWDNLVDRMVEHGKSYGYAHRPDCMEKNGFPLSNQRIAETLSTSYSMFLHSKGKKQVSDGDNHGYGFGYRIFDIEGVEEEYVDKNKFFNMNFVFIDENTIKVKTSVTDLS